MGYKTTDDERLFGEMCKDAFFKSVDDDIRRSEEEELELKITLKHKRWVNRFFREIIFERNFVPYPDIDNAFERFKSRFCIFINFPLGKMLPKGLGKKWRYVKKHVIKQKRHP